MLDQVAWLFTVISIVGVVMNIRRRRECFYVWSVTNAFWFVLDIYKEVYSQAALQGVYFALAVWGLMEWKKHDK